MSIFAYPRTFYGPSEASFTPLFRLLDDFESYSREAQGGAHGRRHQRHSVRTFSPRFDIRETDAAYELHGELPGIDRDNVEIEFTDPQTLVVRGSVERSYAAGTPPAGALGDSVNKAAIADGAASDAQEPAKDNNTGVSHKATVEDEVEEGTAQEDNTTTAISTAQPTPAETPAEPTAPADKFWVTERSIGQFSRTFNLPARVDQDAVTANLNNGILTVVVPKAKKHEARRIAVN